MHFLQIQGLSHQRINDFFPVATNPTWLHRVKVFFSLHGFPVDVFVRHRDRSVIPPTSRSLWACSLTTWTLACAETIFFESAVVLFTSPRRPYERRTIVLSADVQDLDWFSSDYRVSQNCIYSREVLHRKSSKFAPLVNIYRNISQLGIKYCNRI